MSDYTINLDFSNTTMGMAQVNKIISDRIHQAVGLAAQSIYATWADKVMQAPGIWHPERIAYVKSLQWTYTGEHSARIWTENKTAEEIETGRPARDLKRMLQTSNKTRQGKNGKYLIIPFRHNIPAGDGHSSNAKQMPPEIYAIARMLPTSKVTGKSTRVSATGATVPQSIYKWGGRLPVGLAPKLNASHASDPYAGMVKMSEKGTSKAAAYLTFRVLSERSKGWIIPAKPGQFIAKQVAADSRPNVEAIFQDSLSSS